MQVADLFDVGINTINYHIKEIFKSSRIPRACPGSSEVCNLITSATGLPVGIYNRRIK